MSLERRDGESRSRGAPSKAHRGRAGYLRGLHSEEIVERHLSDLGYRVLHRRWRGQAGEIDLIAVQRDCLVFVEVKASRSFDAAAEQLGARQVARLYSAAEEFLGLCDGQNWQEMRFDVALVDGSGRVKLLENALIQ